MTDFDPNEPQATEGAGQSAIMSQLSGGGGEFDVATATAPKRTLPLQAISVGVVLIIAAVTLMLMRQQGTRAGIDVAPRSNNKWRRCANWAAICLV